MAGSEAVSFVERVRCSLQSLSVAERRLAELLLDFPGDLASYSASELASLANVSNATVTRLIRRLGYRGYDEARRKVRSEREAGAALFFQRSERDGAGGSIDDHGRQAAANIEGTFQRIDEAVLLDIAVRILAAKRVWVLGFRGSQGLAAYIRWQLLQVVENVLLVPGAGETLAETVASMTKGDVLIAFLLRRRLAVMPVIVSQARRAGADVAAFTDGPAEEIDATWTLRCDTAAPGPLDNPAAVIALCHLLATAVMEKAGTDGRRRLRDLERIHTLTQTF